MSNLRVLLIACYELGHQPLSLAWPTAVLRDAGHDVSCLDLAVESFRPGLAKQADLVGIAVPMHTALRLGVQAAKQVRAVNPNVHICFYGLYAELNADYLLRERLANSIVSGEYEESLRDLAFALANGQNATSVTGIHTTAHVAKANLARLAFPVPDRRDLPPIREYAHFVEGDVVVPAGYVETSRGCLHTCLHCPVVPVYQGRFFVVPVDVVMADIRQQVAEGVKHISFGDPDFLNGPKHALGVTRALNNEFPQISFDFTTKVEHILKYRHYFPEFRELGTKFVISAFEATSDTILQELDKGHTVADMETALDILQSAGIHIQPTWMPFTPWTTMDDYLHLLAWIRQHDLIAHVPAVQLAIRLLIPPKSYLLQQNGSAPWLADLDAANFTYRWQHPDPCMDELQQAVTRLAEGASHDPFMTFSSIEQVAHQMSGREYIPHPSSHQIHLTPPRLTEDWFC